MKRIPCFLPAILRLEILENKQVARCLFCLLFQLSNGTLLNVSDLKMCVSVRNFRLLIARSHPMSKNRKTRKKIERKTKCSIHNGS